jgi:hypothetical protein
MAGAGRLFENRTGIEARQPSLLCGVQRSPAPRMTGVHRFALGGKSSRHLPGTSLTARSGPSVPTGIPVTSYSSNRRRYGRIATSNVASSATDQRAAHQHRRRGGWSYRLPYPHRPWLARAGRLRPLGTLRSTNQALQSERQGQSSHEGRLGAEGTQSAQFR